MPVLFNKFRFRNLNGIEARVYLEAPIGTRILDLTVRPDSDANIPQFSVENVATLKLTVLADPDDHSPDTETIDLTKADPYPVYVTSFTARSAIAPD